VSIHVDDITAIQAAGRVNHHLMIHTGYAGDMVMNKADIMGNHQDGHAFIEFGQDPVEFFSGRAVNIGSWFVKEQQVWAKG